MALTDQLTEYYKFSGNSVDSVSANNGTDTNITYNTSNGKIGQGAGFDGATSKIVLGTAIARPTNVSVSAWIKTASNSANQFIFADSDVGASNWWAFILQGGQKLRFSWANSNGNNQQWETTNVVISDTNFHHVVATCVGSTGTPVVYVDNVSAAMTGLSNSGATLPTAQGTQIGSWTPASQFFNGAIDELGVWTRALSSGEVSQLYNNGNGLQYPFVFGGQPLNLLNVA